MNDPGIASVERELREQFQLADKPVGHPAETSLLSPEQRREISIISASTASRAQVNAFRNLRTRLLAIAGGQSITTVVAPVSKGSGGSFIARNLAAAMAFEEGRNALLVDCDLLEPSQHTTMRINTDNGGLTDYLDSPAVEVEDILYETGIARFRLIPAGTAPRPDNEYFTRFKMRLLIDSLSYRYPDRYLFLDSPPVLGAPDARLLSHLADVVVLVAGYGRDTPEAIAEAAANFDPAKFAGVVFNEGV